MIYNISISNDMGHLIINPSNIPRDIHNFILSKINLYIRTATDTSNLGCRFYILSEGLNKQQTYYLNNDNDIINLTYYTDTFDPNRMRYI